MLNEILSAVLIVFIFMSLMYVLAQYLKNNSIVDVGWGIGFILIALALWFNTTADMKDIIITVVVGIWGIRLALHIHLRNRGKGEDFRYAEWRKNWGDKAAFIAFYKVFLLQGLIMLFVSYPVIYTFSSPDKSIGLVNLIGLAMFVFGFLFETIADYQLSRFKKDTRNKGKIITSGLWKVTRHPNYFGEAVLWWGVALFAVDTLISSTVLISPLILNILLLKVSGVPLLEQKYKDHPDWDEYKRKTPAFIPLIGRK